MESKIKIGGNVGEEYKERFILFTSVMSEFYVCISHTGS